eukprot:TRINITY_DN11756_c0_g1_i1.p1 TRINITY_DN11756_c0_g1~~TRINITY_DN11756_c0_g1_i1.p1  ORF type:complete len:157 (-),score=16.00 TRINITY_DN11756_c0_g1_i1:48-518(-)
MDCCSCDNVSFTEDFLEAHNFKYLNSHLNMTVNEFSAMFLLNKKPFMAYREGEITIEEVIARIEGALNLIRWMATKGAQCDAFKFTTWILMLAFLLCVLIIFITGKIWKSSAELEKKLKIFIHHDTELLKMKQDSYGRDSVQSHGEVQKRSVKAEN